MAVQDVVGPNDRGLAFRDSLNDMLAMRMAALAASNGQGGPVAATRARLFEREAFKIVEGDRSLGISEDINRAIRAGVFMVADPTKSGVVSSTVTTPANLKFDGQRKQFEPTTAFASAGTLQSPSVLNTIAGRVANTPDYGSHQAVIWQLPYVSDAAGFHPDSSKYVVGQMIGDDVSEVRLMNELLITTRGFYINRWYKGKNVYINTLAFFNTSGAWMNNHRWSCTENSGERMVFAFGSMSDCRNQNGTATSFLIDPAAVTMDGYHFGISNSYSQTDFDIPHGGQWLFGTHDESNGLQSRVKLRQTSGRVQSSFTKFGGVIGGGPNISWTNRSPYNEPVEWGCGRAAFWDLLGARCSAVMVAVGIGNFRTRQNTELVRDVKRQAQSRISIIAPHFDGGYRVLANGGNGSAPLGGGAFPAFCYTHLNELYLPAAGATTGVTLQGGWSVTTDRVLNVDNTGFVLNRSTAVTTSSGMLFSAFPVQPGKTVFAEVSYQVDGYGDGNVGLRIQYYVDAALTIRARDTSGEIVQGITGNTGVSSTGATITIPDPTYPNVGLYTPGTMQSGAVTVGDDLSGTGINGRCFVGEDLGNGTYKVDFADAYTTGIAPSAVGPTTIYHHMRVCAAIPVPDGAHYVLIQLYSCGIPGGSGNIQMVATGSRPRAWQA